MSEIWSKMCIGVHVKCRLFLSDFNEIWTISKDFSKKYSNIKFHENPSSGSRVVTCGGGTDGQTDMTSLIAAFRDFAKEPWKAEWLSSKWQSVDCIGSGKVRQDHSGQFWTKRWTLGSLSSHRTSSESVRIQACPEAAFFTIILNKLLRLLIMAWLRPNVWPLSETNLVPCLFKPHHIMVLGRDSSVDIATALRAGQFGDRIPVWVARFSALVHTCPAAHPASCTMGTGSFPKGLSGRGVALTTHPI